MIAIKFLQSDAVGALYQALASFGGKSFIKVVDS